MPAYGGAAGTLVAAQQQHLQPPAGGYQGTVAASTPHPRVSEGGGAAAYAASPQGLGREDGRLGGTVVVRQSVDSGGGDGWGATVVSSVQPSPAGHRAGEKRGGENEGQSAGRALQHGERWTAARVCRLVIVAAVW